MRNFWIGVSTMIVMLLLTPCALSRGPLTGSSQLTEDKLSLIETNLVIGLKDNSRPLLQASAASVVKQLKTLAPSYGFSSTVIPLMEILKDESKYEPTRIMAALALQSLNSQEGNYAIKMTAKYTDQARLKKILEAISAETK